MEIGVEAGTPCGSGYLQLASQLYAAAKPLLAIKAYERALSEDENVVSVADVQSLEADELVPCYALFKDFVLHCNALSIKSVERNIKVARDVLRLCFGELQRRNYVRGNPETENHSEIAITSQSDEGITFLVAVTLNNWACLLIRSGEMEKAAAFLQTALSISVTQELTRIVLLNMCTLYINNCCFPETRVAATEVFGEEGKNGEEEEEDKAPRDNNINKDLNELLIAFAYHNVAIAGEYFGPQEAESYYDKAKNIMMASPYQQWSGVIEYARRRFQEIVQRRREEAAQRRELAEVEMEAAKQVEATVRRKGKGVKNGIRQSFSRKSISRGRKFKRDVSGNAYDVKDEPIELPPVDKHLLRQLRAKGLAVAVIPLLRIEEVENTVFGRTRAIGESLFSPLMDPRPDNVAMILMCEETPLQVVDEADLEGSTPVKRSIWSLFAPRHADVEASPLPPPKRVPGGMVSTEAMDIAKLFLLPPLSEKSIENAQRDFTGVKKLLSHRLALLLRAENAFEEKWRATMIVKSALIAFNVAQDIIKLKASLKDKRERRTFLENASARRIVRFFRMVCETRLSNEARVPKADRIKYLEMKASTTLQKYTRRWLAVKELRALQSRRQSEILRIVKIQSVYHGHVARCRYLALKNEKQLEMEAQRREEAREFAALQIQRAYRRHAQRLCRWFEKGEARQFILHHFKHSRDYYATIIQKLFRGFLVRRIYGREVYAKRCYGRNCYRAAVLNTCAVAIQSAFRGHRVRRATKVLLQQHLRQRLKEREEKQRWRGDEAAKVIQCAYRCYMARRAAAQLRGLRERERLLRRKLRYPSFRLEEQVY